MGSITSWVRLEPRCRDDEMSEAVHARIYDPLWMLARQWQAGEFQGEDTGSPVLARWRADSAPITRYYAGAIKKETNVGAPRYDAKAMPLEALVERRPLRRPTNEGSLRLAVESGMHFLRMLDGQPISRSYRADFLARFALQPPTDPERTQRRRGDSFVLEADGDARTGRTSTRCSVPQRFRKAHSDTPRALPIAAGDKAEVDNTINDWLAPARYAVFASTAKRSRCVEFRAAGVCVLDQWGARKRRDSAHISAVRGGSSRLAQRRLRSRDQPRRGCRQGDHCGCANCDPRAGHFPGRACAALLGD